MKETPVVDRSTVGPSSAESSESLCSASSSEEEDDLLGDLEGCLSEVLEPMWIA